MRTNRGHIYKRTDTRTYIDIQVNNLIYRLDIPTNRQLQKHIADAAETNLLLIEKNFSLTSKYVKEYTVKMIETLNLICEEYNNGRMDEAYILQQIEESVKSYQQEAKDIPMYVSKIMRERYERLTTQERIVINSKEINLLKQSEIIYDEQIDASRFQRLYLKSLESQLASDLLVEKYHNDKPDVYGFDSNLSNSTLETICRLMNEKGYIKATFKDFNAIFSGKLLHNINPIVWCIKNRNRKPNQKSLSEFIELMVTNVSLLTNKSEAIIQIAFVDQNGNGLKVNKKDDRYFSNYLKEFESIIAIAKELPGHV